MAVYIMLDDVDISAVEAIKKSQLLMKGKKGKLLLGNETNSEKS